MRRGEYCESKIRKQLSRLATELTDEAHRLQRYDGDGLDHAQLCNLRRAGAELRSTAARIRGVCEKPCKRVFSRPQWTR